MARYEDTGWIQTYTGRQFWPLKPKAEDVDLIDIAHALSNICRFTGHCRRFYSVAEHSCILAKQVPPADALWGLLHDASEAYLCDLPRPIKRAIPNYQELEDRVMAAVCERFGLPREMPESVKEADLRMLATEQRDLMTSPPVSWASLAGVEPYRESLVISREPYETRTWFIDMFNGLQLVRRLR